MYSTHGRFQHSLLFYKKSFSPVSTQLDFIYIQYIHAVHTLMWLKKIYTTMPTSVMIFFRKYCKPIDKQGNFVWSNRITSLLLFFDSYSIYNKNGIYVYYDHNVVSLRSLIFGGYVSCVYLVITILMKDLCASKQKIMHKQD